MAQTPLLWMPPSRPGALIWQCWIYPKQSLPTLYIYITIILRSLVYEATRAQILELQAQLGAASGVDPQASQSPSGLGPIII